MSSKKKIAEEPQDNTNWYLLYDEKEEIEQEQVPEDKPLFTAFLWKDVIPGHRCETCGHCESGKDSKDKIILHVLKHVPESERNALLDKLVKEI